jgi:hypothetical protein
MHRLTVSTATLLIAFALPARGADREGAYVTEAGHLMCTSPQALREAEDAISKRDGGWLASIKECRQSKAGQKAEVVQGGVLTAKIRVYDDSGKATIYWTSPTTLKEVRR